MTSSPDFRRGRMSIYDIGTYAEGRSGHNALAQMVYRMSGKGPGGIGRDGRFSARQGRRVAPRQSVCPQRAPTIYHQQAA